MTDRTITADATAPVMGEAEARAKLPPAPALAATGADGGPAPIDDPAQGDARTTHRDAGTPLPAPAVDWDAVDAATALYEAAERAKAADALATPDADAAAVEAEIGPAVAAILADFEEKREAVLMNRDLLPEAKSRYERAFEAGRDAALKAALARQHGRLAAAEERAMSWKPAPPDAGDGRVLNELIRQRDALTPARFVAALARVVADPANRAAVVQAIPYLASAHDDPDHRLRGNVDLRRLVKLAERLAQDRNALIRQARLDRINHLRHVVLAPIARDPKMALVVVGDGTGPVPPRARRDDGIRPNPHAARQAAADALTPAERMNVGRGWGA